jgi:large subunit ribosomal protein L13
MPTQSFSASDVTRQWFVVDVNGVSLGRAAARIASILRGKTKPTYTPHADTGDFVIVVNADKARLTGNKAAAPFRWHTPWMGHLKERPLGDVMAKKPEFIVEKAVKGMLPKGPLGRAMLRKLKVYAGAEHPHAAQKPVVLDIREK